MSIPGQALAITAVQGIGLALLQTIQIKPRRRIGPIEAQATIREHHFDELVITEHPIETGAAITDHAFKLPARVTIQIGFSNSPSPKNTGLAALAGNIITGLADTIKGFGASGNYVNEMYNQLLALQESRIPCDILTAKRKYKNMLLQSVSTDTTRKTAQAAIITIDARQVILVDVTTLTIPQSQQKYPERSAPTQDFGMKQPGPAPNYNPGTGGGQ